MATVKQTAKKTPVKTTAKLVVETLESLQKQAIIIKDEALTLKRNTLTGDVQNVRAYKYKRRELARLLTRINQKKVGKE